MRAMGVRQIPRRIDLVRLHPLQQIDRDGDVVGTDRLLADTARLVEGQVEEVDVVGLHARVAGAGAGLGATDQPLHRLEFGNVHGAGVLLPEELPNPVGDPGRLGAHAEGLAELLDKIDVAVGRLVPDGDVAAGLVGDVDVVTLLAEPDERAAHADHVVVGMGTEHHDPLGERIRAAVRPANAARLAPRPARDRALHPPEDLDVGVVGPAATGEQVLQAVLVVVFVGELEDRLAEFQRQPNHRLLRELWGPLQAHRLQRTDHPRGLEPRQPRCRRPVEHEPGVRMLLQGAGRDVAARRLLDRLADDRRLVLAEGQQHHPAGVEDRSHAHRDRLPGHVPLTEEIAGRVAAGHAVQRDQPGAALDGAARFVEADVTGAADAEQLQVDPARRPDLLLVGDAGGGDPLPRDGAVGKVDRGGWNIEVIEEVLPHEAVVALQRVGLHRPVLVEVERHDRLERHALLAMQPDQLVVHAHWRAAGGQTEHGLLASGGPLLHEVGDLAGDRPAGIGRLVVDSDGQPFHRSDMRQRPAVDRMRRGRRGGGGHGEPSEGMCWRGRVVR